jgi:hypothetical protein
MLELLLDLELVMHKLYCKAPAWAKARPGQALPLAFGLAYDFAKPEPPQARPKPGLSGQAGAGTSLGSMWLWRVCYWAEVGNTTSAGDPQVGRRYLLKIPAGNAPVAPDHNIPTGHGRSGWRFWNFAGTCGYPRVQICSPPLEYSIFCTHYYPHILS